MPRQYIDNVKIYIELSILRNATTVACDIGGLNLFLTSSKKYAVQLTQIIIFFSLHIRWSYVAHIDMPQLALHIAQSSTTQHSIENTKAEILINSKDVISRYSMLEFIVQLRY